MHELYFYTGQYYKICTIVDIVSNNNSNTNNNNNFHENENENDTVEYVDCVQCSVFIKFVQSFESQTHIFENAIL